MAENGYWTSRMNRRRALKLTSGIGASLAGAALLACRKEEQAPASSQTAAGTVQPKRGGFVSYAGGFAGSGDTQELGFDPHVQPPFFVKAYRLFYQGLLGYDLNSYAVVPDAALKWQQPSQSEYIFSLAPGIKWHDKPPVNGRDLTTDDVVASLERARSNNPRFITAGLLSSIDKIEATDKSTVRITTKQPDASTLTKLTSDNLIFLSRELIDRGARLATAEEAIGTGAFVLKSAEAGVGAEYVRNPSYWRDGLPYLDGFRSRHFADLDTAWAAFQAGAVDIARIPGRETQKYIAGKGAGYQPSWHPDDSIIFNLANVKVAPMNDARIPKALRLLVDHEEMIRAATEVFSGRGRHGLLFATAVQSWDLTHDEYERYLEWKQPKDEAVKEALSLLNAAGYNRDNHLAFTMVGHAPQQGEGATLAFLLQAQWKRLAPGVVDAEVKLVDNATVNQLRATKDYTYAMFGQSVGAPDPDVWLETGFRTGGSANLMNFSDPKLDDMISRQRTLFDAQQRKAAIREIVIYMIENGPSSIPGNRFQLNATKPQVQGYQQEFYLSGRQYQEVWLDT